MASNRQVISVSRRTDIPALYAEWFMHRLEQGFACYRNPFGGTLHEVSLKPEDVLAVVFWSRNYAPLLPYLPEFDRRGYGAYFQCTITGYGAPFERAAPPVKVVLDGCKRLAERYSPRHLVWRFDPIIFSTKTPQAALLEQFTRLAEQLQGATERCIISFVDVYQKTRRALDALAEQGIHWHEPATEEKQALAAHLVELAASHGMQLYACCEPDVLNLPGIQQAHCVDALLLHHLFPDRFHPLKKAPTRKGCGCFASRDIGAYDTCIHGCVYCYANSSYATALKRFQAHEPTHPCLAG